MINNVHLLNDWGIIKRGGWEEEGKEYHHSLTGILLLLLFSQWSAKVLVSVENSLFVHVIWFELEFTKDISQLTHINFHYQLTNRVIEFLQRLDMLPIHSFSIDLKHRDFRSRTNIDIITQNKNKNKSNKNIITHRLFI